MTRRVVPLIVCGGAGTRLWPASREVRPKQFLPLFGTRSTFQDTLMRVSDAGLFERLIVITNAAYRFMVPEQLAEISVKADVLLEPAPRDSGPAIAAGAAFAQARDKDAVVLALAADHVVRDTPAKRITVKPGSRLSLQKHHHRSEHWIVARGAARVTINEVVKTVHENESVYIPIGAVHRLENPGKILLELIEVQTGSYLGEDDIIRIEDDYRRS